MSISESSNYLKRKEQKQEQFVKAPIPYSFANAQKEIIIPHIIMICCIKCVCGTAALQHSLDLFLPSQFLNKDNSLFFTEGIFLVIKELQ